MSPTLAVETSDLAAAARLLTRDGEQVWTRVGAALEDAMACTGMAGDDPGGLDWARQYELSASGAASAAEDVINGAFAVSSLLSATALNYANADAASTIDERHAVDAAVGALPGPESVTLGARFAGVGGGPPNAPWGWAYVERFVRRLWPNGHQDRLRRAAAAWQRSAETLDAHAFEVESAPGPALDDRLPEATDIRDTCSSLAGHMCDVADAHRTLARACEQFAHHLDVAHSAIEHQIAEFIAETLALQAAGNLLSDMTLGIAEIPTQAVEAQRVLALAARIGELLDTLATAVREIVASLPLVTEISARVSAALDRLLSTRVVIAEVTGVGGLRVLTLGRDTRAVTTAAQQAGEAGAAARLEQDATLPSELRAAESGRAGAWNKLRTLDDHFIDHGSDVDATSPQDYADKAKAFFERGLRGELKIKIDPKSGDILMYDPEAHLFASYTSSGGVRTFFRPDELNYFNEQRGRSLLP